MTSTKPARIDPGTCYACDAANGGVTMHNGALKSACLRHRDPTIKAAFYCQYCGRPTRANNGVYVDTAEYAHKSCIEADARANA